MAGHRDPSAFFRVQKSRTGTGDSGDMIPLKDTESPPTINITRYQYEITMIIDLHIRILGGMASTLRPILYTPVRDALENLLSEAE